MKTSALKYMILSWIGSFTLIILLLVPFHALLTVWLSTVVGHYTALRLWSEVLFLLSGLGVIGLLLIDHKIRSHTLPRRLVQLILAFFVVNVVWGLVALHYHDVSLKALGYGWILDLRFPLFFLITWTVALRTKRLHDAWRPAVLIPATIVVIFGLLQAFILPYDFLKHFGYDSSTIYPYETINHNIHYVRVISTLRGANPLGAYLVVPISLLSVYIVRGKRNWRYIALLVGAILTLYFSFSRSAWIGATLAVLIILALSLRTARAKQLAAAGSLSFLLVIGAGFAVFHNSTPIQNVLLHTQSHTTAKVSSNAGHVGALRNGLRDIEHQPLGRGPGTAGPASVYNNHPSRIAENFFIQIGQETGWLGLLLFLLINAGVGYLLWCRRSDTLALALFASLIGLSFVNLLSHAWADDTLAYIWWGLAGIAMVKAPKDA